MSKGTYSFTTPIYYVNAEPHLGTAYTTVAADTVARYQRMNGYDVAFVTGMDEHGQKVADTAESKGMTPQAWCDSMEPAFRNVWDLLGITYTDFVRTTQPRHARTVQKFWQDLFDKGWCYKGSYEGWYCVHEETYYAESADLVKIFGVDAYRYYFMSDVQFGHDGNISMERMVQVYNADLANTWGNLCSRVFNMTNKYFDGRVPAVPADAAERVANPMLPIVEQLYAKYDACMSQVDFTGAAAAVQELAGRVNLYVEESAPWNLAKKEETQGDLAAVIYNALEAIRIIALYMAPFMPNTSNEVFDRLSLGKVTDVVDVEGATKWGQLPAGNTVTVGDPLFPRLNMDEIQIEE